MVPLPPAEARPDVLAPILGTKVLQQVRVRQAFPLRAERRQPPAQAVQVPRVEQEARVQRSLEVPLVSASEAQLQA